MQHLVCLHHVIIDKHQFSTINVYLYPEKDLVIVPNMNAHGNHCRACKEGTIQAVFLLETDSLMMNWAPLHATSIPPSTYTNTTTAYSPG